MCGIVGLFLKDPKPLNPSWAQMLTDMLITMTDRGPDSGRNRDLQRCKRDGLGKLTVQSEDPDERFQGSWTAICMTPSGSRSPCWSKVDACGA